MHKRVGVLVIARDALGALAGTPDRARRDRPVRPAVLRRTRHRTGHDDPLDEQVESLPPRLPAGGACLARPPAREVLTRRLLTPLDRTLARWLPNLFAYQLIARLTPHREDTVSARGPADEVFGPRLGAVPAQLRGAGARTVEN